jgi:hypothetical protein
MASKLADILQQEYKTKGLVGGSVSALGKSSLEKMDVRNILFGGSGLGSIVGRKVFGKGYSATAGSNNTGVSSLLKESTNLNNPILEQINQNTSYMPAMARDMNVLRQSLSKFLISQKISPANTPDKYFEKAKQREDIYESTFNKKSKILLECAKPKCNIEFLLLLSINSNIYHSIIILVILLISSNSSLLFL